jgi:hypothetical protein
MIMARGRKRSENLSAPELRGARQPEELRDALPPEPEGSPQQAGDTTVSAPDRDRVAMRAYELYLERGGSDGRALDDWLSAERELEHPGRQSER